MNAIMQVTGIWKKISYIETFIFLIKYIFRFIKKASQTLIIALKPVLIN